MSRSPKYQRPKAKLVVSGTISLQKISHIQAAKTHNAAQKRSEQVLLKATFYTPSDVTSNVDTFGTAKFAAELP
jgi:hypothetical protein